MLSNPLFVVTYLPFQGMANDDEGVRGRAPAAGSKKQSWTLNLSTLPPTYLVSTGRSKERYKIIIQSNTIQLYDETLDTVCKISLGIDQTAVSNTILSGTLNRTDTTIIFIVDELELYQSESCHTWTKQRRLSCLYDILKHYYSWDEHACFCQIQIASFFTYRYIPQVPHQTLWLYDNDSLTVYYWSPSLYDKPIAFQTEQFNTFWIEKTDKPDVYRLEDYPTQILLVQTLQTSHKLYHMFSKQTRWQLPCRLNPKFQKWEWVEP